MSTAFLGVTGVSNAAPGDVAVPDAAVAALTVPSAPRLLEDYSFGDGSVTVFFITGPYDPAVHAETTGYEVSTDGGSTWSSIDTETALSTDHHVGTVSGLTNKQSYDIAVRATSTVGPSAASDPLTATPARLPGAPVGVTVSTSPGKVTASWSAPPTDAGSFPVGAYDVLYHFPVGAGDRRGGVLCQTPAAVLTCTVDAQFTAEWQIVVHAKDTRSNAGDGSAPVGIGAVPFPSTVPTSNGTLTRGAGSSDKVVAGKVVTVSGSGYRPGSTVTVLMYSTPQVLTTVVADSSGNFTATATVPAGLAPGQHTLVASGTDPLGSQRFTTLPVTVSAAGVATVTGPRLAATGADVTVPLLGGLAAVTVGGGLIMVSRRRSAA